MTVKMEKIVKFIENIKILPGKINRICPKNTLTFMYNSVKFSADLVIKSITIKFDLLVQR